MKKSPCTQTLQRLAAALALALSTGTAPAQVTVYSDDFDVDNTANWVTNVTGIGFNFADFHFDYSTVGIPSAPNSTGGTTRGLKLAANLGEAGLFPAGISVSPLNFGITVNFELRFDLWMNYPQEELSPTLVGGAGYGTAGTNAQVAGVADSVFIGAATEGSQTSADYRVYGPGVAISYQNLDHIIRTDPTTPLVYAAGTRDNNNTYYTTNFPGQPVPQAQTNLFPRQTGTLALDGTIGFKWRDVKLRKVGNTITYFIDDILIATVDSIDAQTITNAMGGTPAPLGGTNIHFNLYDIGGGGATDIDATNLLFALYDNVRITDFTNVVTVTATTASTKEGSGTPAVFTLSRSAAGEVVTINYTMSGTATNGVDYTNLTGSVTFEAAATSTNIYIQAIDDAVTEEPELVVFNITPSPNYVSGGGATVTIDDNELNVLRLSSISSQMYERTNDYCEMRVTRLGDLQAASYTVNLAFAGSAGGGDFYLPATVTLDPGLAGTNFIISPIEDSLYENSETVICSLAAAGGGEYTIGSPSSVTNTILNATLSPETILFSDNFDVDSSAAWTLYSTDTNGPTADYSAAFAYDYSGLGIPSSPHGSGGTTGLLMTVNKSDVDAKAAALNLYPNGQSFSGDFALRFDMFLAVVPGSLATEHALCGINHSGARTNWFRSGAGGILSSNWAFDGIFCGIGADASGSAPGDYGFFSSPNTNAGPTRLTNAPASRFTTNEFKRPPYSLAGAPGNNTTNSPSFTPLTPIWVDVEISKIGNLVTLWLNNTRILNYTNTTPYTSGNIMLGYDDPFDSIGNIYSFVVYDNVRVVSVSPPLISVQPVGSANAVGSSKTFSVTATTSTGITNYQWFFRFFSGLTFSNEVAIANATNNTYTIPSVALAHYGFYRVEVNDGRYATGSATVALTPPVPVINVAPPSRAAVVGSTLTFTVTASTFNGITNYQWMYYGTNASGAGISGAITRNLRLANVQPVSFGGPYTVRVSDGFTSVTSSPPALLTMAVSPTISAPVLIPAGLTYSFGTEFGPAYVVEFKSSLTNAAWTKIRTNAGTGSPISVTNMLTGNEGYFRIRLQ